MELQNKTAIVTGGGQGIGKAIARRFLLAGARVLIADLDPEAGAETAAEFAPLGEVLFFETDVGDENSVRMLMGEAVERFGGIDALVNDAGLIFEESLAKTTPKAWARVLATNLTGPFLCSRLAAPRLRAARGAIVNIASTRALMSMPGNEAYAATKAGLIGLTHALANSLGPEVRVNCISPGWIDVGEWKKKSARRPSDLRPEDHAQHPAGRVGRPEDIAELALFLAAEKTAGFITGANFIADGGMTRKMIYLD